MPYHSVLPCPLNKITENAFSVGGEFQHVENVTLYHSYTLSYGIDYHPNDLVL